MIKCLALVLLCATSGLQAKRTWLTPYQATYHAMDGTKVIGEAKQSLQYAADTRQFQLTMASKAKVLFLTDRRSETSWFAIHEETLQPHRYRYHIDTGLKTKKLLQSFQYPSMQQTI